MYGTEYRIPLQASPSRKIVLVVVVVLLAFGVTFVETCPQFCTCKWKGGKRRVDCVGKNLSSLISHIDVETQVLDYARNPIHGLGDRLFERLGLVNLQKLYLSECQVARVNDSALYALSNLIELDLSRNLLADVPTANFAHLPLLMKLTLSGNPIRVLRTNAFSALRYLTVLDLSDCQIDTIQPDVFAGIDKMEQLKLDGNKLRHFKHVYSTPSITSGLTLHRNPWTCDCHLRIFHRWLTKWRKVVPVPTEPLCEDPAAFRDRPISHLTVEELACAPCVIPSSLFVEIDEGKNISFVCQVNAVPEAAISWQFEGVPVVSGANDGGQNNSSNVSSSSLVVYPFYKYYAEDATTEQVSELFVYGATLRNNGTYRCTAENVAGKYTSNYTLKVMPKANPPSNEVAQAASTAPHIQHILVTAVGILLTATLVVVPIILCMTYVHRRRRTKRICLLADGGVGAALNGRGGDHRTNKSKAAVIVSSSGGGRCRRPSRHHLSSTSPNSHYHQQEQRQQQQRLHLPQTITDPLKSAVIGVVEYEIVKLQENNSSSSPTTGEIHGKAPSSEQCHNPDLIITTTTSTAAEEHTQDQQLQKEDETQFLFLSSPSVKDTGRQHFRHHHHEQGPLHQQQQYFIDTVAKLYLADESSVSQQLTAITTAAVPVTSPPGIINLYWSPSPHSIADNLPNLYINPFDDYCGGTTTTTATTFDGGNGTAAVQIDPTTGGVKNCWAVQVAPAATVEGEVVPFHSDNSREQFLNEQNTHYRATEKQSHELMPITKLDTSSSLVNIRHNLEGYPYPSSNDDLIKLTNGVAFTNLNLKVENVLVDTPILSPPDPFKTDFNNASTKTKCEQAEIETQ